MQQLQTTVLNKIQPGKNPVFIIAPGIGDAQHLATYLSYYLKPTDANTIYNKSNSINANFFSTPELLNLFARIESDNTTDSKENRDKVRFLLNSNFDNGLIWGLQCSYQNFFDLELFSIYENAFFIFLYGTPPPNPAQEELLLQKVIDFHFSNLQRSVIVHVNNTISLGAILLESLQFDDRNYRVKQGSKDETLILQNTNNFTFPTYIKGYSVPKQLEELNKENLLSKNNKWFSGSEFIAIIILHKLPATDLILSKIIQIVTSFIDYPNLHILCENDADRNEINKLAHERLGRVPMNIAGWGNNITEYIGRIIKDSSAQKVIIDNLNLSYSLLDVLSPFKKDPPPAFCFGNLLANKIINILPGKISLPDILATHMLLDNITFSKATWEQINGFDSNLHEDIMLWDFCIRALNIPGNYALESVAEITNNEYTPVPKDQALHEGNYAAVIEKHKDLFAANLNQVLTLISENQFVPQNEIINLNHKITTLDIFLKHSKDEVKSLNDFSLNLQTRIKTLESSRFYRWAERIRHYKRIFFKEKKPGKGFLKRIFGFIHFMFTKPGFKIARKIIKAGFRRLYLIAEDRPVKIVFLDEENENSGKFGNYNEWMHNKLNFEELNKEYLSGIQSIKNKPKISIIIPVYNPPVEFLKKAIESVIFQLYDNWELCIADDCSTNPQIKRLLNSYTLKDKRIKVVFRPQNGHISACSNSALELATGEYIFCLDHDDLLTQNCLFEVVKHINEHPDNEIIYSDEDKIDDSGSFSTPYFKPDWAPANLLAKNYITHITVYKKQLLDTLGGYRLGFEGSQDYDLILRATELTSKIGHIPKVLYHWRIHKASAAQDADVKPYAFFAAKKALEESLVRRNTPGEVQYLPGLMGYRVKYKVTNFGKVSIIIPTKDHAKLTQNTIDSIIALTDYPNYEIIVLNNNSSTPEFFQLMDSYKEKYSDIFRCIEAPFPFNFSKLMNLGASSSTGEYVLLLNNDVEIINNDWLTRMVSFAQQKHIGAVGVKLIYPDDNIQHAGTVIGLGGVAGHVLVNFYKDDPGYFNYLQSTTNYSAVTAACLMVRRSVYDEVNGMDEKLEVEFNDVDFCLKIMDKGYFNIYVPDVVLYHYESATRGHPHQNKVSYERSQRESKYFLEKWDKYIKNDPFYNPNLRYDVQDFKVNYDA